MVLRADDPELLTRAAVAGLGIARSEVHRLARVRAVASWVADVMSSRADWLVRGG